MTRHARSSLIGAVLLLVASLPALALWGRYPNAKPVKEPGWPRPVVAAINAHPRVYGAGSAGEGWTFYFTGKTPDLNKFLALLAKETVAPLEVVLTAEPGEGRVLLEPDGKDLDLKFNWSLHLDRLRDRAVVERREGETDAQYERRRARELERVPEFAVAVTVHCAGPIDPAALRIPLPFGAAVAGRLESLADFHNWRREQADADRKPLADAPPTTEADLEKQSDLGDPQGEADAWEDAPPPPPPQEPRKR